MAPPPKERPLSRSLEKGLLAEPEGPEGDPGPAEMVPLPPALFDEGEPAPVPPVAELLGPPSPVPIVEGPSPAPEGFNPPVLITFCPKNPTAGLACPNWMGAQSSFPVSGSRYRLLTKRILFVFSS